MKRWTAPLVVGLWMAGCGFFSFPAPERAPEDQEGGGEGGTRSGGGTSGMGGKSGTSGAAGETNGGTGGESPEGGTSGASSGAAGAGEGAGGAGEGGTAGSTMGGKGGSGGAGSGGAGSGGGGGGSGGAAPTEPVMTGLKLWLDAASFTNLGPIATWPNRITTGGEPDATQPASTQRPEVALFDGRRGVSFDGTKWMTFGDGFEAFTAGLSFFLVARFDAPGVCTEIFQVSNGLEMDDISVQSDVNGTDPGVLLFEVGNVNAGTGPGVLGGLDPMLAAILVRPPSSASIFIDTVSGAMRTDPLFVPAMVPRTNNFLGSGLYLNCDPFEGVIFELLLYNRGLTVGDVALVSAYLQQKWACCGG
jgi:hypothetical protein